MLRSGTVISIIKWLLHKMLSFQCPAIVFNTVVGRPEIRGLGVWGAYSVPWVTGGNSWSSSSLKPPRGGESAAVVISWNFSDSAGGRKVAILQEKCMWLISSCSSRQKIKCIASFSALHTWNYISLFEHFSRFKKYNRH